MDDDNLHEMMDEVHMSSDLDNAMKYGENLRNAKDEAVDTSVFVNQLASGLKTQWKPSKLRINQESLKFRS